MLPLAPKIGIGVGAGLVAAGVVGAVWHWVEARFVSDAAKRARLDALYYGTAVPALDQFPHVLQLGLNCVEL